MALVPLTDRQKAIALTGLILVWCAVALPVDRYVLQPRAAWFSELLVIKNAEIIVKPLSRTITWLGFTLTLVTPAVLCAVGFAAYRKFGLKRPLKDGLAICGTISFWFFTIPLWVWLGDSIYRVAWSFLVDWKWSEVLIKFLDEFVLKGDVMIYSFRLFQIEGGFGAMLGAAIGVALLCKHALWNQLQDENWRP